MTVAVAKKRVRAAELRVLAVRQREMAEGYLRQAGHPIYVGQDLVCTGKAAEVEALASRNEAEANLIEAEAEG